MIITHMLKCLNTTPQKRTVSDRLKLDCSGKIPISPPIRFLAYKSNTGRYSTKACTRTGNQRIIFFFFKNCLKLIFGFDCNIELFVWIIDWPNCFTYRLKTIYSPLWLAMPLSEPVCDASLKYPIIIRNFEKHRFLRNRPPTSHPFLF